MRAKKEPVCGILTSSFLADAFRPTPVSRKRSTAVSPAGIRSDPCTWHVAAWKACAGNDLRPRGCRKPVTAMACGRWLWKARNCCKSHLPKFCGACWARHTMLPEIDLAGGLWPGAVTTPGLSRRLASSVVWRVLSSGACPRQALLLLSHQPHTRLRRRRGSAGITT